MVVANTQHQTNIFYLPDLGEGLPDAEVYEWFVKIGDEVEAFQPLVSMETAKAVVDVPSPQAGIITKIYGKPGDVIKTGAPLIEFAKNNNTKIDSGTVVGNIEESQLIDNQNFIIGSNPSDYCRPKTTPSVRLKASQLGINLNSVKPSGEYHVITMNDLDAYIQKSPNNLITDDFELLTGVRKSMYQSMIASKESISVTIFDEADLNLWDTKTDITLRLIRAIQEACNLEPALNSWFDSKKIARKCMQQINLGIAMDQDNQLFAPVIPDIANQSDQFIRETINQYKESVKNRTLNAEQFKGATITLSNFGKFGGKFASPIIVPPTVAILAVGKIYWGPIVDSNKQIQAHRLAPLSLSFDHRIVTGGEATRFLSYVVNALQRK